MAQELFKIKLGPERQGQVVGALLMTKQLNLEWIYFYFVTGMDSRLAFVLLSVLLLSCCGKVQVEGQWVWPRRTPMV
jgi:hypothetical protein